MSATVKVLVVEDEIILAHDIRDRLTDMNYEVVGIAPSVAKAVAILEAQKDIDIIMIDIILKGDQDGIELAKIVNEKYHLPFIFLTSHADSSLVERAKKVHPYAYILKPFNDRQVKIAIELALMNFSNKTPGKDVFESKESNVETSQVLQIKDSLFLKKNHHFERVPLAEILFIEADNNYCTIYTKSERFVYAVVMKKVEQQLPVANFIRTHRSYIVNISQVTGFEGNMLFVGTHKIPVSKSQKEHIFKLFRTI
ncbi:LytTR family transcriptional regulator DNA-binding domain-containing protein [Kordia sp. YSTF-M3]|uniref:LytTR family transcriptional regulator DNA-binding domain-containing protein n=1 Tax=Kordia aestuariivivens TaxID=2759037 RepID=A0ABR7Q4D2_9FLAO|nr:LytTR family transcriptional regulator DNA-binding domain-containing protein [Kordia aestuariivivens]MBC8753407.1 LytTR family transcriptional regulator DNA-binding domain-containing protein [Kordia aestuariivivens]